MFHVAHRLFGEAQTQMLYFLLSLKWNPLAHCISSLPPHQTASQIGTRNDSRGPLEPSRQIETLFVNACGCLHDWVLSSICKHRYPQQRFSRVGQLQRGRLGCRSRGFGHVWFEAKLKQVHEEGNLQKVKDENKSSCLFCHVLTLCNPL